MPLCRLAEPLLRRLYQQAGYKTAFLHLCSMQKSLVTGEASLYALP